MTTDDGLKGLTDEQWWLLFWAMQDDFKKEPDIQNMPEAARAWLAANVHDNCQPVDDSSDNVHDSGDGISPEIVSRIFFTGYHSGHHDTVESQYTDVPYSERFTYFLDDANELIESGELNKAAILAEKGVCMTDKKGELNGFTVIETDGGVVPSGNTRQRTPEQEADFLRKLENLKADIRQNIEDIKL